MKLLKLIVLAAAIYSSPLLGQESVAIKQYDRDTVCLAKNIYYESRGESRLGKLATAKVTLNRHDNDELFPSKTICGIVYQPKQFSWTNDAKLLKQPKDAEAWGQALALATYARSTGVPELKNFTAVFFHNNKVPVQIKASWRKKYKFVSSIGNHIYYDVKKLQRNRKKLQTN